MHIASQTDIREQQLAPFTAEDGGPVADIRTQTANLVLQGDGMDRLFRLAEMMAQGVVATPVHLRGKPSDCLAIVMQATQWNMNPYVVAQKTHVVNGTLGYEAQLVNAVVQNSGAIVGEFEYEFQGAKGAVECRVGAKRRGKPGEITWGEWLSEADVTTKNSPLWKTNVRQQLGYLQVKNWARLYTPGAILGVYSQDELEGEPLSPRNMGQAEVVRAASAATAAANESSHPKLAEADKAAGLGVAAYSKFWSELDKADRLQIAPGHEARKQRATAADANRTVDNGVNTNAAPSPATGGGPVFTYAYVADRMKTALDKKDQAALDIAADLIGAVADEGQRTELEALYEAHTAELA